MNAGAPEPGDELVERDVAGDPEHAHDADDADDAGDAYDADDGSADAAYDDLTDDFSDDFSHDVSDDPGDDAGDVDDPMDAGEAAAEVPFEPVDLTPDAPTPSPPVTGDAAIDESMAELAEAQAGSSAERIEAGERAHRLLQGRLADLGGA